MDVIQRPLIISVIGGGFPPPEALIQAQEVGRELAKRGVAVVCGALTGVMDAVCKGAKEQGGLTIGILPGDSPEDSNPYVDIPICTGIGYSRNVTVVQTGRAVIAIDGSYGTLSEIGHALAANTPVIGLGTWDISIYGKQDDNIIRAKDPVDAVVKAIKAAKLRDKGCKSNSKLS
tara:strand:+ start:182 stop:706 length:525 start_codon:yes stop_codon:yes gene_type:complete